MGTLLAIWDFLASLPWDTILGILGLVATIVGIAYGVRSERKITQAFNRTEEANARSQKAVGVAQAAIQRAYGTMIGIKTAVPEKSRLEAAIHDGLDALAQIEKEEIEPLLREAPPAARIWPSAPLNCRAARALLAMSQAERARAAVVPIASVMDFWRSVRLISTPSRAPWNGLASSLSTEIILE